MFKTHVNIKIIDLYVNKGKIKLKNKKSTLYKVWEKYGMPEKLVHPDEILKFLEDIIIATKGLLNSEYYGGGYQDNIHSVTKEGNYFYLYWKNFEDIADDPTQWKTIALFGYNTYVYQAMDIKSLIFLEDNYNLYIVVNCRYFTKRELLKELIKKHGIKKEDIDTIEVNNWNEFLFKDKNNYNHSCQLIPFPIHSLLIQDKINPLNDKAAEYIMRNFPKLEFNEQLGNWRNEISELVDYVDENELKKLGNEIRSETEKALKYYIIKNAEYSYENIDTEKVEKFTPLYKDILEQYDHQQIGQLEKKIKKVNPEFDLPKNFVITLNKLSHDSGRTTYKKDVETAIDAFEQLLKRYILN